MLKSINEIKTSLADKKYICDDALASAIYVAFTLGRPLLVEGAAGVGKTEIAKVMASVLGRELVRLQCHTGIDETRSLYEWNYQKQLLAIQARTQSGERDAESLMHSIFSEEYLLERPLLRSIRSEKPVVLLIDEMDKTDEEFEAFLLELLAEMQVTIPEFGTIRAVTTPFIVLTSNNTRPLSDALRRRCVYAYLEYPDVRKELAIINARFPGVPERLAQDVAEAVQVLRAETGIIKKPSIAETLDWLAALTSLGVSRLDRDAVENTIGALLKSQSDTREALANDKFAGSRD